VSLAAALAIPLETAAGTAFPGRDLVIFLTLAVIVVTLAGQGLTLRPLAVRLGLEDDGSGEREDVLARVSAAEAALERLDALEHEDWVYPDTIERVRAMFDYRRRRFTGSTELKATAMKRARAPTSGFCARPLPPSATGCSSCATTDGSAMTSGGPLSETSTTRSRGLRIEAGAA
jgi:CPA1 family monovalent cation:H+ antiporter